MTSFTCINAAERSLADMAEAVTRSFEGYFVPIHMDEAHLLSMIRRDSVDMADSRLLMADGAVIGAALIARRGWTSRLAAMGIVSAWRGKGAGKYLLRQLLDEARGRGDHEMVLEVIEQNDPAVRLYEGAGFRKVRRLVGLRCEEASGGSASGLEEMDIRELGKLVALHGLGDLPWQLSAESIAQFSAPYRAYRLPSAYALISDPEQADIRIYCLLVEQQMRGRGLGTQMVRGLLACHPGKQWHVPAILPEEVEGPFRAAGFHRDVLSQWQMTEAL